MVDISGGVIEIQFQRKRTFSQLQGHFSPFGDLSDEEILDTLENDYCYFENGYPREALDFDKMADFVYDYDGAVGLSGYDGQIKYVYGFHVIRED